MPLTNPTPAASHRSIDITGNVTGSVVFSGDNNIVTNAARVTLPPAETIDPKAELAALSALLETLNIPKNKSRLQNELANAEEEAANPAPDKDYVAGALGRALTVAKTATDFGEQVEKLAPIVTKLAAWAGPVGQSLLSFVGLTT